MLLSVSLVTVNSSCFLKSGFDVPLYVAKLENTHFRSYAYNIAFNKLRKDVGVTTMKQSAYSPNLNLCDLFLFTRLQGNCRIQHCNLAEDLKTDVQRFMNQLPKSCF